MTPTKLSLTALFIFTLLAVLAPNPFGNNPDIIGDESYFLTSALSGIQKATPPGIVFEAAGNYYGGPQTYLDTVVLAPVIGGLLAVNHFSLSKTETVVALHTGDLLALLRFVNSLCVVLFLGFFFVYFTKRKIQRPLALQFLFLLFLLFSNSLILGFVHTAKVWTFYLLMDLSVGALFIANEYYLSHLHKPFIKKETYVALMVWAGIIAFFQNYVGVFPIALWVCYALLLKHINFQDVFSYLLKRWYLIAGFSILQLSFIYRAIFVKNHTGLWDPGQVSVTSLGNGVDWFHRLSNPLVFAVQSQPLVLLYAIALIGALIAFARHSLSMNRRGLLVGIACVHPLLIYVIFHVAFGFSLFPRYSLPLTVATTLAIVILAGQSKLFMRAGLVLSGILFIVMGIHAITLYWQPSSDVILTQMLEEKLNTSNNVLIEEPSAWRLSLPLNTTSLSLLNARHKSMSRYTYLLSHSDSINSLVTFKPTVMTADTASEVSADLAQFKTASTSVWTISTDCTNLCNDTEMQMGTCFMLNLKSCNAVPQEINTLPDFLSFTQLGTSYVVRKVH